MMNDVVTQPSVSPNAASSASPGGQQQPPRKKQKRNKPTLSCEECVERKTKVSAIYRSRRTIGARRYLRIPTVYTTHDTRMLKLSRSAIVPGHTA